ncbi:MarR family winged helix-turn-helix transcriptional regulator [Paenimyroides ceti]
MQKETIISNEDKYNLLTGRTPILVARHLSHNLKKAGINMTKEQWSVLAILWKTDGCSQQMLAKQTYRDKPSITRLINHLEKEEYVIRKPAKNDKRLNLIYLTNKAKSIEKEVITVMNETIETATKGISDTEIELIKKAFYTIYQNLQKQTL